MALPKKSGSRSAESRRVTSFKQPSYPRGSRISRPNTVDEFRADAKAYGAKLKKDYFSKSA